MAKLVGFGVLIIALVVSLRALLKGDEDIGTEYKIEKFPWRDAALIMTLGILVDLLLLSTRSHLTVPFVLGVHATSLALVGLALWVHSRTRTAHRNDSFGFFYSVLMFFFVRPMRLLLVALMVAIASGVLFSWQGFYESQATLGGNGSPELIRFSSHGMQAFPKGLYLSLVTITTVGYGDLEPYRYSRLVAVVEAGFGFFLISLLVALVVSRLADTELKAAMQQKLRGRRR